MIQVREGSIFDSKSDLVVIPCDNRGRMTNAVLQNLQRLNLPTRIAPVTHGKVCFLQVLHEYASVVAYGASVDIANLPTTKQVISSIARELRDYCRDNNLSSVNLPLLGSGAGGMTAFASFSALCEELESDTQTVYNIFCFTREAYAAVSSSYVAPMMQNVVRPRVFMSYATDDKRNVRWVEDLASYLRHNGIDVRMDKSHLHGGDYMAQWMTNEIILAHKVLLICDKYYLQRANFRTGGVGFETMIIQGDMLTQGDNSQKYIAILREKSVEDGLPIYVRAKYALRWGRRWPSDDQKEKLVLRLFGCDAEPELGDIPSYVQEQLKRKMQTHPGPGRRLNE